ncbi:MAG TPA: PDZ domain-containing protein [Candidatus Acidoferrum sp.]
MGIVYLFGARGEGREERHRVGRNPDNTEPERLCVDETDAALLGVRGCPVDIGFRVTVVRAESAASRAGMSAGDVIVSIDDRPVRTAAEIETAIGSGKAAVASVGYLIKGNWKTVREVKVR